MDDRKTSGLSIQRLAQVAPAIRGLLATPTGDDDMPYRPIILKTLATQAAIDFEKLGQPRPSALERLERPPLYLDVIGSYESAAAFRKQLAGRFEAYAAQHGAKPQAICLRDLGILYVSDSAPDSHQPLRNKVALVTGSAGAIGHGICRALLNQGCYLAATDLPGERLDAQVREFAETAGDRVLGVPLDVTDPDSVAQGFDRVVQTWGGVDIVIVNAGIALTSPLTELSLEAFQKLEKVNVEGTLLTLAASG